MKTKPNLEITLHEKAPDLPKSPDLSADYAITSRPHVDLEAFAYTREEIEEAARNSIPLYPRRRARVAGVGRVGPAFDTLEIEIRWESRFDRNLRLAQGAGGEEFARRFAAASKAFQDEPTRFQIHSRYGGVTRPPIRSILIP